PTWKTIQTSATTHTDPRSALLYMNHSCQPSLELGLAGKVTVSGSKGIEPGDALTFFYPSTEWKFDRSFDCLCGAPEDVCLGKVQGASAIERQKLGNWFFNDHILKLAAKR
ncbi:hypothetical protein DOTSEDRAFT_114950, partial [Dothistroma septosporum NZE10]